MPPQGGSKGRVAPAKTECQHGKLSQLVRAPLGAAACAARGRLSQTQHLGQHYNTWQCATDCRRGLRWPPVDKFGVNEYAEYMATTLSTTGPIYHLSSRYTIAIGPAGLVVAQAQGGAARLVRDAAGLLRMCAAAAGGARPVRQVAILAALVIEAEATGRTELDALLAPVLAALGAQADGYQHTAFGVLTSIVRGDARYLNLAVQTLADERACKSAEAWQL